MITLEVQKLVARALHFISVGSVGQNFYQYIQTGIGEKQYKSSCLPVCFDFLPFLV